MFITLLQMTSNTGHKISFNLPMATTISLAMKMAASAHCGCQTVHLMADSSATATVSSQREAASIFPIVPNEISITNMQVYQYFHGFRPHRASTGWLHDGWNTTPVCTVWVGRLHIIQLMILKTQCGWIYCLLTHFLFEMLPSLHCSLCLLFPFSLFSLCSAHSSKAIAWCRALSNGLFVNLFFLSLSPFSFSFSLPSPNIFNRDWHTGLA